VVAILAIVALKPMRKAMRDRQAMPANARAAAAE
jgi:hypothetical protein